MSCKKDSECDAEIGNIDLQYEHSNDVDVDTVASLLNQASHDIAVENASIMELDTGINAEADGNITYEISLRLNATEEAQFNNIFEDLFI